MLIEILAGVAQSVEQLTCNQQVGGSNPLAGSSFKRRYSNGGMAEWSMATDCKSVDGSLPWFKSMFHHQNFIQADLAQPAEHIHGKDGVFGSNPKIGFIR